MAMKTKGNFYFVRQVKDKTNYNLIECMKLRILEVEIEGLKKYQSQN